MKRKSLFAALAVTLLLSGCGATVDLNTPKSAELKQEYSFYQNSVDKIRTVMKVTPEEADDIFIILTDCGIDSEINYIDSELVNIMSKLNNINYTNYIVETKKVESSADSSGNASSSTQSSSDSSSEEEKSENKNISACLSTAKIII